jgi:hypothetical protein
MPEHWRANVFLPDDWYEVPGDSRAYRRRSEGSGWLRLTLLPPERELATDGDAVVARLEELIEQFGGPDTGEKIGSAYGPCNEGLLATSLWKSPRYGILRFWLIPGRMTLFACFEMGDPESVGQETSDAQDMMESVHFTQIRDSPLTRP